MRHWSSIRSTQDFRRVSARGKRSTLPGMTVSAVVGEGPALAIGLAVRKGAGSAVVRNRVKRRLRGALDVLGPVGAGAAVIQADGSILELPFQELVKTLRTSMSAA